MVPLIMAFRAYVGADTPDSCSWNVTVIPRAFVVKVALGVEGRVVRPTSSRRCSPSLGLIAYEGDAEEGEYDGGGSDNDDEDASELILQVEADAIATVIAIVEG